VHFVAVPRSVVAEAVVSLPSRDYLAFAGLSESTSTSPLGRLCPLELGELVEDAVRVLTLRRLVAAVVEGAYPGSVLLKLPPEQNKRTVAKARRRALP
jgi:hypothetical protein